MSYYSSGRSRPCIFRRVIGDILIAAVAVLTVWVSVIMIPRITSVVLKDNYIMNYAAEIGICLLFMILALDIRFGILSKGRSNLTMALGMILRCFIVLLCASILFFAGKAISKSFIKNDSPAQYAIVLGLALQNGKPTDNLISRIDTARDYIDKYPDSTLILAGGNADDSGRTEAKVMQELLEERGVAPDKMILVENAKTTRDIFTYITQMTDTSAPVVLISSDYHMDRASGIAGRAGFSNVMLYPSPSPVSELPANIMWEIIADFLELPGQIMTFSFT
ncbi:MAG: YdcF family protein [Clostridiales bacterium]|nr:YdcF family protein [Clostridiales bacterium]